MRDPLYVPVAINIKLVEPSFDPPSTSLIEPLPPDPPRAQVFPMVVLPQLSSRVTCGGDGLERPGQGSSAQDGQTRRAGVDGSEREEAAGRYVTMDGPNYPRG